MEIIAKILDACCGSRMFWYDKENPSVTFIDNRQFYEKLPSGHIVDVNPNIVADENEVDGICKGEIKNETKRYCIKQI